MNGTEALKLLSDIIGNSKWHKRHGKEVIERDYLDTLILHLLAECDESPSPRQTYQRSGRGREQRRVGVGK